MQISESSDTVSIESVLILSVPGAGAGACACACACACAQMQNKDQPRLVSGFSLGLTIIIPWLIKSSM